MIQGEGSLLSLEREITKELPRGCFVALVDIDSMRMRADGGKKASREFSLMSAVAPGQQLQQLLLCSSSRARRRRSEVISIPFFVSYKTISRVSSFIFGPACSFAGEACHLSDAASAVFTGCRKFTLAVRLDALFLLSV